MKKGQHSAGVQRQFTGTAGRIENTQVGVFLSYASPLGRSLIDCRLYVPRSWMADRDRCAAAGITPGLEFATKPQLARHMIEDALDAGVQVKFVTADGSVRNTRVSAVYLIHHWEAWHQRPARVFELRNPHARNPLRDNLFPEAAPIAASG